jgi:serine/threonine protein kinase
MELRLTGNPSRSPQTDVYSLGVLLFHLLTGTYPVGGGNLQEVREAHTLGKRIALGVARPDLPNTIVGVIERAIDPDPTNRYDGPEALGSELTTLLASGVDDRSAATRVDATESNLRELQTSDSGRATVAGGWAPAAVALLGSVSLWLTARSGAESPPNNSLNPEVEFLEVLSLAEKGRLEEAYEHALRFRSALAALDEAVAQGFVCVACFETSLLLEPVRALPGYRPIKERAFDRQRSFGRRFGFPN